jgi:hypothetical protein
MKVPAKFKQWPTLYRYGYEDGERGDANVGDRFTAGARKAYEAGYDLAAKKSFEEHP